MENINDIDKIIELFADDATIELRYLGSLGKPWQWHGKDVLNEFLRSLPQTLSGFVFGNIRIHIDTPGQVFGEYEVDARVVATGLPYKQAYMG